MPADPTRPSAPPAYLAAPPEPSEAPPPWLPDLVFLLGTGNEERRWLVPITYDHQKPAYSADALGYVVAMDRLSRRPDPSCLC